MAMRIGRAGASGSKNAAIWNDAVGSLTTAGLTPVQFGRSKTQRTVNHGERWIVALACAIWRGAIGTTPGSGWSSAATSAASREARSVASAAKLTCVAVTNWKRNVGHCAEPTRYTDLTVSSWFLLGRIAFIAAISETPLRWMFCSA